MGNEIDKLLGIIEIYTNGSMVSFMRWQSFVQKYHQLKNQNVSIYSLEKMRYLLLNAEVLLEDPNEAKMYQALKQTLQTNQINPYQKR